MFGERLGLSGYHHVASRPFVWEVGVLVGVLGMEGGILLPLVFHRKFRVFSVSV
ncbi:hypothetical protein M433DRAFT_10232 [Acidomyces richmondensis BFW]|nr:hypothetical protein M433DRAFT_10232 [Acidomyces richmondensis BFW]